MKPWLLRKQASVYHTVKRSLRNQEGGASQMKPDLEPAECGLRP